MLWTFSVLGAALAVTLGAPLLRKPAGWSVRHPAGALVTWVGVFVAGCSALAGSAIAVVIVAITEQSAASAWLTTTAVVVSAWVSLGVMGALLAVVGTRVDQWSTSNNARRAELLLLTACATERVEVIGDVDVFHVRCERPFAMSLRDCGPRIVISSSLESALDAAQLRAVIEHERAHLKWRHDLVVSVAGLAQCTLPWLPAGRAFRRSVGLLVELVADDCAARVCGPAACAGALEQLHLADAAPGADLRAKRVRTRPVKRHRLTGAGRSSAAAANWK